MFCCLPWRRSPTLDRCALTGAAADAAQFVRAQRLRRGVDNGLLLPADNGADLGLGGGELANDVHGRAPSWVARGFGAPKFDQPAGACDTVNSDRGTLAVPPLFNESV